MKRRQSQRKKSSSNQQDVDGSRKKRSRRSSTENSSQEIDDQSPETVEVKPEPPPILDPLSMYNISRQILSYLNVQELKVARQVCRMWSVEGGKMLLERSFIRLAKVIKPPEGSKKNRMDLKRFITVPGAPRHLKIIFHPNDEMKHVIYLLNRVPQLRKRVHQLTFEGCSQELPIKGLSTVLRKLPRLQILKSKKLNLLGRGHWWLSKDGSSSSGDSSDEEEERNQVDNEQDQENSQIHQEEEEPVQEPEQVVKKNSYMYFILNKLEKLKEIQLDFKIKMDNFSQYKVNCDKFKGITHLSLDSPRRGGIRREDLVFLGSPKFNPWKLTHLTWQLSTQFDKDLVRKALLRVAGTLKYLHVFCGWTMDTAQPWLNNWYIPVEMNSLVSVKLHGRDQHVFSCLAIALQFPKLKTISIQNAPKNLKKRISNWEKSPLANDKKLQSNSIKEVEVGGNITSGSKDLINCSLCPQLNSLKVGPIFTNVMTKKLIQSWKDIERLELDFSSVTGGDLDKIEQWMCGKVSKAIYNSETSEDEKEDDEEEEVSFKNLTNLKCLTVNNSRIFTDYVVKNSLKQMKLQTIRFHNCMISQTTLDKLKGELPTTAILIDP